ncbi:MAG: rod shape-determining protein RodA [Pseudomonadota bacterium]|nr:rod shape-determining protein RodA [Pseudomonadota bacterium]
MFSEPIHAPQPTFTERLKAFNWLFLIPVAMLAGIGAAALYSIAGGSLEPWAERHVIRFCAGLGLLFAVALVDIRVWIKSAYPVYILAFLLLAAVPLIGVENSGARRWLALGSLSFQPSELMKIALVLAMARYYQWLPPQKVSNPLALVVPLLMVVAPAALVAAQPDLGTAVLFTVVGLGLMFLAGVSWLYFVAAAVGVVSTLPFLFQRLHDYQKERVLTFIDPERDPMGAGYHILQSKIALGSGGITGKGYMQGTQSHLNFLPEKHTDFIFTMFAEEMGFIGGIGLLGLYLLLLLAIVYMALRCRSMFARLAVGGVGLGLFVYIFINAAMVMGLVPVVGVPLPLVSYGGTSMLTVMFGLGLVLNAHIHRKTRFRKHEIGAL